MQTLKDWGTLIVAVLTVLAGFYATRASRETTRANQEANQIKWLQEARIESDNTKRELREAREDTHEAREELAEARRSLAQAKRDLVQATDVIEELSRWAVRVITWAHDPNVDRQELERLINGGPAYLRLQQGRQPEGPL